MKLFDECSSRREAGFLSNALDITWSCCPKLILTTVCRQLQESVGASCSRPYSLSVTLEIDGGERVLLLGYRSWLLKDSLKKGEKKWSRWFSSQTNLVFQALQICSCPATPFIRRRRLSKLLVVTGSKRTEESRKNSELISDIDIERPYQCRDR